MGKIQPERQDNYWYWLFNSNHWTARLSKILIFIFLFIILFTFLNSAIKCLLGVK
jgi:hypothetical protein